MRSERDEAAARRLPELLALVPMYDAPIPVKAILADAHKRHGWSDSTCYAVLRVARRAGLAKLTQKRGGGTLQFFEEALPMSERDIPSSRSVASALSACRGADQNGPWRPRRLFQVEGGEYTADQLEGLAHAVLEELGQVQP